MSFTTNEVSPAARLLSDEAQVSKESGLRPTLKRILILLLLLAFVSSVATWARAGGAHPAQQKVRSDPNSDVAVLAHPSGGYTIFVADGRLKTIRYLEVSAKSDIEGWNLKDFKTIELKGERVPLRPTALAVNSAALYVASYDEEAVYAIDLKTYESRPVLQRPDIYKPLSIAVSESGRLAVGQDGENVLIYDTGLQGARPRRMPGQKIDDPVRVQFITSASQKSPSLLVLDSDNGGELTLYEPSGQDTDEYKAKPVQIPASVASRLERRDDTSLDSAFIDGTYYLTEGRNWAVFSRLGLTSARWVLFPAMYKLTPSRLCTAGGSLFALDMKRGEVYALALKQMTIRMEVAAPEANAMLAELYKKLYDESRGSLPEREYVVRSSDRSGRRSLEELLKTEHVLAPGSYTPTFANSSPQGEPPADTLERVLCLLNRDFNQWQQCPKSAEEPIKERRLPRQFGEGQALVIPGLGVEQAPYEGAVPLRDGKTVEEAIRERLMVENPFTQVTTEYLMRKDPAYYRTIDYELTRRGYILPSFSLQSFQPTPGSLLKIVQNREQSAAGPGCEGSWADVAGQMRSAPVPELTEKLRSYAPSLSYLPRKSPALNDLAVMAEWKKMGITAIEMVFEQPIEVRGSREALTAQSAPGCWESFAGKDAYVVSDIIRVSGARFRLLHKDGATARLKQAELDRWGIDAVVDEPDDWSLKVTLPYVLAYRALPWDGKPLVSEKQPIRVSTDMPEPSLRFILDPHLIKPRSVQDIWAKTDGKFFLPGLRWEIKLLTDSSTLAEGSVIRKWAAQYPDKVYVWPAPGGGPDDSEPATIVAGHREAPAPSDLTVVTSNRNDIRKSIAFPADVNSGDIIIGLMERTGSIQRLNPDFAWREIQDKENCTPEDPCQWDFVWLEAPEDGSPPERLRRTVPAVKREVRSREKIEAEGEKYWQDNHGTHVAGLLASNNEDAKGLVPDAKIGWLELGNSKMLLPEQVKLQDHHSLRVINVSQEFLAGSYNWLENQLQREGAALKTKLFVVAAGNDGCDLNELKCVELKKQDTGEETCEDSDLILKPPVAWRHRFHNNVLSVSATDTEHKFLFRDKCSYRVNYGVRYVDLLAPGYEVYSSTENSAYAATTGTSQAVPLVTATAAVLAKLMAQADPSLLKARLIYTADWEGNTLEERKKWDPNHSYLERVWGGSLNAGRAIMGYDQDIFHYKFGNTDQHRAIQEIPDRLPLVIKNSGEAFFVEPTRPDAKFEVAVVEDESRIQFGQVLRMTRLRNGLYRIIYRDKDKLRIIMNASIDRAEFTFRSYKEVIGNRPAEQSIILRQPEKFRLDTIIDYVGKSSKMGLKISF